MLQSLYIKNFALIEQLQIDFSDGFSIITGETGAGKSILLGALGLLLGNRADLSSLKDKEQKCVIEAHFKVSDYALKDTFSTLGMDYEDVTIIRREILPSGKSRAFVNDSPVNLQELQELGTYLIDIHSQHQTRELNDEQYQMNILDAVAGTGSLLTEYTKSLATYKNILSQIKTLKERKTALAKERDYNLYLLEELQTAKLRAGEQQELEAELEVLGNIEFLKENMGRSLAIITDEQGGARVNLNEVRTALQKISTVSDEYAQFFERISSILIEFDDFSDSLSQNFEKLADDPQRLEYINQKLQVIYMLQKKHAVGTVEELIAIQQGLEAEVLTADEIDSNIAALEQQADLAKEATDSKADAIHEKREKAVPVLSDKIVEILASLGMPNARFNFELTYTNSYYNSGRDALQLLFSANKGTSFGLLKKVASGGEMSRIMLAVKAILASYSKLPTIIFDEIDTGVSGEIANKMGVIMKDMSRTMQVFAITHLPQIAAKGNLHYKVSKAVQADTTVSELTLLSSEDRIREIAEMLSGKDITDSALNHARALLN
jgi:DNA repair protein RecN (Recombination protein N)